MTPRNSIQSPFEHPFDIFGDAPFLRRINETLLAAIIVTGGALVARWAMPEIANAPEGPFVAMLNVVWRFAGWVAIPLGAITAHVLVLWAREILWQTGDSLSPATFGKSARICQFYQNAAQMIGLVGTLWGLAEGFQGLAQAANRDQATRDFLASLTPALGNSLWAMVVALAAYGLAYITDSHMRELEKWQDAARSRRRVRPLQVFQ